MGLFVCFLVDTADLIFELKLFIFGRNEADPIF